MSKYIVFVERANGTNIVHQGDDLVRLVQMCNHWLSRGRWTSAHISVNPLFVTH